MKKKNLKHYQEEFQNISPSQYERVMDYLNNHPFRKTDVEKFHKSLKRIQKIKSNYLKIVIDIIPEPTPRPRMGQFGFYVKNSHDNNEFVRLMVKDKKELYHYITTPCKFIVKNYFPIPKSFNKVDTLLAELGMIEMISRPDWDNLGKTYSDMIQKWILSDDSLIIHGESYKFYSLKPRVEIIIEYRNSHSCKRNQKMVEQSTSFKKGVDQNELFKTKKSKF